MRAAKLTEELAVEEEEGVVLADTAEMARCVGQALHLKDIAELRPRLVPEWPIYGLMGSRGTQAIAGRVDAVAIDEGRADIVIDWKSDVAPTETTIAKQRAQLSQYLAVTDTERGALVYLTTGQIRWVTSQELLYLRNLRSKRLGRDKTFLHFCNKTRWLAGRVHHANLLIWRE